MLLQFPADLIHVDLRLGILGLHGLHLVAGFFEEAEEALFLLLVPAEVLQLDHQTGQGVPHLAQVLGAHVVQRALGEGGYALLGGHAVLQDHLGIAQIDLLGEVVHHFFLCLGEHTVVDDDGLYLRLFRLRGGGLGLRAQGEGRCLHLCGVGVQGQLGHHALHITHCCFLRLFHQYRWSWSWPPAVPVRRSV